ncbi:MAG: cytochrome b N-terminal domain-containing protein, partial [Bryobacterales bacterium]|nr:cytochrome b N-terminal domain-containing protein [Bryobacterales bacterium]
ATLSRFFAIHVFLIPAIIFAFIGYHLYLVIHNGISEPAKAGHPVNLKTYRPWYEDLLRRAGVPFWPEVAWRDVVFGLAMLCGIVILAAVFHAPELTQPPDPTILQAEPRPDWYLLWYYAVLAMSPYYMENYIMILGPLLAGTALILLPIIFNSGERSPSRRPWSIGIVILIVMMIGTMWVEGKRAPWSPDFNAQPLRARDSRNLEPAAQQGAALFFRQGCEYCHTIEGQGGERGPNLSTVADRLTTEQMTIRILNGGTNMPAFAGILKPDELTNILAFLATRHANSPRARSDAYPNHIQPALGRTFNTGAKPGITKAKALFRI